MSNQPGRHRILFSVASFIFRAAAVLILLGGGGWWLLAHPETPVPPHWNPLRELNVLAPVTPVTTYQMNRAVADTRHCRAVLADAGIAFEPMEDLVVDQNCGISGRGLLSQLATARIETIETSCATTLRLAMWEHHVVQPAAREVLNSSVRRLRHVGSYNCRRMRTARGASGGWSSHATADAIDIIGVQLADGRSLTLLSDWQDEDAQAEFLHRIGRGACDWFRVVLGPNYNRLHADHFHLQGPGWGFCR